MTHRADMTNIRWAILSFLSSLLLISFAQTARAASYELSDSSIMVGQLESAVVRGDEDKYQIARRYDVGTDELVTANPGIDFKAKLSSGTVMIVPTLHLMPKKHKGIIINLAERRLYFFRDDTHIYAYPVGIAGEGWDTPIGELTIIQKLKHPTWHVPKAVLKMQKERYDRILPPTIPPGPDNPLGDYALRLSKPNFLIHGTNEPKYVGSRVTAGCYRMYPEDIEELYSMVKVGTKVTIVNHPIKLGFTSSRAFIEVHPAVLVPSAIPLTSAHLNWLNEELHLPNYMSAKLMLWSQKHHQKIVDQKIQTIIDAHIGIPQPISENVHVKSTS